jgi:hypothetical protein
MHVRFDLLDIKIQGQFERSIAVLESLADETRRNYDLLQNLRESVQAMREEMLQQFHTIQQQIATPMDSKCQSKPLPALEILRECRDYYAQMAFEGFAGSTLTTSELQRIRDRWIRAGKQGEFLVHPESFVSNSEAYVDIYRYNQERSIFLEPASGRAKSLSDLITAGDQLLATYSGIALTPNQPGFELRKDFFNGLLNQYEIEGKRKLLEGAKLSKSVPEGPNPFKGAEQTPGGSTLSFYKAPIEFCLDSKPRDVHVGGRYGGAIKHWSKFGFVHGGYIAYFHSSWIKGGPEFNYLLPNEAIWAASMGRPKGPRGENEFADVKLEPCWREISFTKFSPGSGFKVRLNLEFRLSYKVPNQPSIEDVVVSRGLLEEDVSLKNTDMRFNEKDCGLFNQYWFSTSYCPSDDVKQKDWRPVSSDLEHRLKKQDSTDPRWEDFKQYFASFMKERADDLINGLDRAYPTKPIGESLNAKKALSLAVSMGLNDGHAVVSDFAEWVEIRLPNDRELVEIGIRNGPATKDLFRDLELLVLATKQKIEQMSHSTGLTPNTRRLSEVVRELYAVQGP